MTTVTTMASRSGRLIWIVKWGPGITQSAICLTKAEADEVKVTHKPIKGSIEPLVGFRPAWLKAL